LGGSPYSQTVLIGGANLFGIYSLHSLVNVQNCYFNNLKYGIYATYMPGRFTATIQRSQFTDNYRGVYLGGATLTPTVILNKFSILDNPINTDLLRSYGLYLDACDAYEVEENELWTTTLNNTGGNLGIIVNQSGGNPNEIYLNSFHDLFRGTQDQNTNASKSIPVDMYGNIIVGGLITSQGLENICNTFSNINDFDIGVTSGKGINYFQGFNGFPAGNCFSQTSVNGYHDIYTWTLGTKSVKCYRCWTYNCTFPFNIYKCL
jgi:hypothetical protein